MNIANISVRQGTAMRDAENLLNMKVLPQEQM